MRKISSYILLLSILGCSFLKKTHTSNDKVKILFNKKCKRLITGGNLVIVNKENDKISFYKDCSKTKKTNVIYPNSSGLIKLCLDKHIKTDFKIILRMDNFETVNFSVDSFANYKNDTIFFDLKYNIKNCNYLESLIEYD